MHICFLALSRRRVINGVHCWRPVPGTERQFWANRTIPTLSNFEEFSQIVFLYWAQRPVVVHSPEPLRGRLERERGGLSRVGKVSREWFLLQSPLLVCSPSRLNIADWSKRVLSQILHISHAQWIYRNASLHDARVGYLREVRRATILEEVNRLARLDPADVPGAVGIFLKFSLVRLKT